MTTQIRKARPDKVLEILLKQLMPTWNTIALFLAATSVLVITPGPIMMYLVACSLDRGRRVGLIAALGVGTGTLIHVLAAAIGISALLASSPLAFTLIKYAGAGYLIYLGIQTLIARQTEQGKFVPQSVDRIFIQSAFINILNPKTALFFFAWLPRFVDPSRGTITLQIVVFGALVMLLGFCNDSLYVLLSGTVRQWVRNNTSFFKMQRYLAGFVYLALGAIAVR